MMGKLDHLDLQDESHKLIAILEQIPEAKKAVSTFQFRTGLQLLKYRNKRNLSYQEMADILTEQTGIQFDQYEISMMEWGEESIPDEKYQVAIDTLHLNVETMMR